METAITSTSNPTFKLLKKLTTKKGRREHNLCIIEGEKVIFENLELIDQVFIIEGKQITPNLADLEPIVLSKKLFNEITDHVAPQGIFATCQIPICDFEGVKPCTYLILDRIQDCGNMGNILRTAAAFGYSTIFAIDCADPFSQKSLRAGMANQFKLNVIDTDYIALEKLLQTEQFIDAQLFIADMGGVSVQSIEEHSPLSSPLGLVLGNEGQGISPQLLKLPHTKVSILMSNNVESLNVATAGAILMFQLANPSAKVKFDL